LTGRRKISSGPAYSGSAGTIRFLLDRGYDIESRDTIRDSTALWFGGEHPSSGR